MTGAGPDDTPPERPAPLTYECVEWEHEARDAIEGNDGNCNIGTPARKAWVDHYVRLDRPEWSIEVSEHRLLWRREGQTWEEVEADLDAPFGPTSYTPAAERPGDWYLSSYQVDWAGNRSEYGPEVHLVFPEDCGYETRNETEVGCGCDASPPGGLTSAIVLFLLLGLRAQRKRKRP